MDGEKAERAECKEDRNDDEDNKADESAKNDEMQEENTIAVQSSLLPGSSLLYIGCPLFLPQSPRNLVRRPLFSFAHPWHPVVSTYPVFAQSYSTTCT